MKHITSELFQSFFLKIWIALLAMLSPTFPLMIAVFILVGIDFIMGTWASVRRGSSITSFKMKRTISKLLVYQSTIVVSFILENFMFQGVPITKIIAAYIGLTEGRSFFEHVKDLTGTDFVNVLIDRLQGKQIDTKELQSLRKDSDGNN